MMTCNCVITNKPGSMRIVQIQSDSNRQRLHRPHVMELNKVKPEDSHIPKIIWLRKRDSVVKCSETRNSEQCSEHALPKRYDNINISGVSVLSSSSVPRIRRLFWLLILLSSISFMIYNLNIYFCKILDKGIERKFSQTVVTPISVPALTVCHNNKHKKSTIISMSKPNTTIQTWYQSSEYMHLDWSNHDLDSFNHAAKYTWREMIETCRIGSLLCEDIGIIKEPVYTQALGACSTFTTNSSTDEAFMMGQVNLMFKETENWFPRQHRGWHIVIHPKEVVVSDLSIMAGMVEVIWLPANTSCSVKVTKQKHRYLAVQMVNKTRSCVADYSSDKSFECFGSCEASMLNYTNRKCHLPWMLQLPGQQPCRSFKSFLLASQRTIDSSMDSDYFASSVYNLSRECQCHVPCNFVKYIASTPYKLTLGELLKITDYRYSGGTVAHLNLWLRSVVEEYTDVWPYQWPQLSSDVGGCLGLMIGGSLLTFVELLDWVLFSLVPRVGFFRR